MQIDSLPAAEVGAPLLAFLDPVGSLPFLIPIVAIVMALGIPLLAIYLDYRKKRDVYTLYHRERLAAIEKGVEVPPLPPALLDDHPGLGPRGPNYLLRGLIWGAIGLGIYFGLTEVEAHVGRLGLVPLAIGVAYLVYYAVEGRKQSSLTDDSQKSETGTPPRVS